MAHESGRSRRRLTAVGAAEASIDTTFLDGETAVVAVRGDVDYASSQQLRRHLYGVVDAGVLRLVVDLGDTAFVSSLALGALLGTMRRLRPRGGQMRVACSSESVRRLFELTMLERALPLYGSVEEALGRWHRTT